MPYSDNGEIIAVLRLYFFPHIKIDIEPQGVTYSGEMQYEKLPSDKQTTFREIAEQLGLSEDAVFRRKDTGVERLEAWLQQNKPDLFC